MAGRDAEGLFSAQESYNDFDVRFTMNPVTRDVVTLGTIGSIEQSVRLLVMTAFYERAYRPYLGTVLASALFENVGSTVIAALPTLLTTYINSYEPRVVVQKINVSSDNQLDGNTILVDVSYLIVGKMKVFDQQITLKRVR